MLQQTQVASVIPYYQRFLERFPTLAVLAAAPVETVMEAWSGLGYYARARNLHRCAQVIMNAHGGAFPHDPEAIAELPGIGRSTANAIAVFSFGAHVPILDGNVKRVLCRTHGIEGFPGTSAIEKRLWALAESLLPARAADTGIYIQAQMDLGATLCTRSQPDCAACPLRAQCVAYREGRTAELPTARPRKVLPQRSTRVLLLCDGERWLFERRPPSGIWGGLLSLPEIIENDDLQHAADALGCAVEAFTPLPSLRHSFTHFQLTLQPLAGTARLLTRAAESGALCWLTRSEIATAALPTPIRRIVEAALATALAQSVPVIPAKAGIQC
jgi:A/G-specific adenine glycosylase